MRSYSSADAIFCVTAIKTEPCEPWLNVYTRYYGSSRNGFYYYFRADMPVAGTRHRYFGYGAGSPDWSLVQGRQIVWGYADLDGCPPVVTWGLTNRRALALPRINFYREPFTRSGILDPLGNGTHHLYCSVPFCYVVFTALVLPMVRLARWSWCRRRRTRIVGGCDFCGYDLRAHRPGQRCPECGQVIGQRL